MWAEQAIFTSVGGGQSGYRVVARSPGVGEAEAAALATWCPAHGALIVDEANRASVNFHPLPGGRSALSRSCAGAAESSGRGGRQVYTHALILDPRALRGAGGVLAVYRDALALGLLRYRPGQPTALAPAELGDLHIPAGTWTAGPGPAGVPTPEEVAEELGRGESVRVRHAGDRLALAAWLLETLPADLAVEVSFSTSLRPSPVRPYRIVFHY